MSHNLLNVPLRQTFQPPIRQALRSYINQKHPETHPDAFKWDISEWESQRKKATSMNVHEDTIALVLRRLAYLLTKLPPDIGLSFSYGQMFSPASPVEISNLHYERASTLLNLAILFCQLGTTEDRASQEGLKRAVLCFKRGAGTISYILSNVLPALQKSLQNAGVPIPTDLDEDFLRFLRGVMIAEAQESAWQKARLNGLSNGSIARLASKASKFYSDSLEFIDADSRLSVYVPEDVIAHLRCKSHHFAAVAQYRLSMDHGVSGKDRFARIQAAMDSASKGKASQEVFNDAKSLDDRINTELRTVSHANDLIYHEDVPPPSTVPPIPGVAVVEDDVLPQLSDPASVLGGARSETLIFGGLESWGIRRACDIFKNQRSNYIEDELAGMQHDSDLVAMSKLNALNLPAALDALSQPIGLPPSLLQQAGKVRSEDGPNKIMKMLEDAPMLANQCRNIIEDAFNGLDEEADYDEELRSAYAQHDRWTRPTSSEANGRLTQRAQTEQQLLARQAMSMRTGGFGSGCTAIDHSGRHPDARTAGARQRQETKVQARALQQLLEKLDDLKSARETILSRSRHLAQEDDIKPSVVRKANTFEAWSEIGPEVFDDIVNEGLAKYDKFRDQLEENASVQEEVLIKIEAQNERFLSSRKEDPTIKEREEKLKSLSKGFQAYIDIKRRLEEDIRFYNEKAVELNGFRIIVNEWCEERRASVRWLEMSLNEVPEHLLSSSGSQAVTSAKKKPEISGMAPEKWNPSLQPAKAETPTESETPTAPSTSPLVVPSIPNTNLGAAASIPSPFSGKWEQTPELTPEPRPKKEPKKKNKAKELA
ncbi:BRO1-like domain-containing protein [Cantharellus anzutake]|uniref:BRO1-like domain-containing protein n=1 Tax=Cantharellus anzutake TaxID=1750568 RepID=UPI001905E447|nr:BRO1-like domain-containing protein [Cantharellus anzutake]KAF8339548.1 BRO1-like domain-containing protein [Cantharellus anzutake]